MTLPEKEVVGIELAFYIFREFRFGNYLCNPDYPFHRVNHEAQPAMYRFLCTGAPRGVMGENMRTLTLVSTGWAMSSDRDAIRVLEQRDEHPRTLLFEDELQSDILDEKALQSAPPLLRACYRRIPVWCAQVLEAYRLRNRYDAIISWAPRLGIPFALLLKFTFSRTRHVALMSWISRPRQAQLLKLAHSHIHRLVLWSSTQKKFAIDVLRIPAGKVAFVSRRPDQHFWRPMNVGTDTICSCGLEMRDYPTLIEAMRGLEIPCHIAAGMPTRKRYTTAEMLFRKANLPAHITAGQLDFVELRDLYARSRFVVIPLLESDTDNGATAIEEAMAMGKAVICSRTSGQVDLVQEGVTGLYVPPGGPVPLRAAILHLWNNPAIAAEMGRKARCVVEQSLTLDRFVADVKKIVQDVIAERV
jgi:glycosyltransferase involved in cell wall biosynthesis